MLRGWKDSRRSGGRRWEAGDKEGREIDLNFMYLFFTLEKFNVKIIKNPS